MSDSALPANRVANGRRAGLMLIVVVIDSVLLELSLLLGFFTRDWIFSLYDQAPLRLANFEEMALGIMLIPVAYGMLGIYPGHGLSAPERLRLRVIGASSILLGLAAWDYVAQNNYWSRGALLATLVYAPFLVATVDHYLDMILSRMDAWLEPVVIIGARETADKAIMSLQQNRSLGYKAIAVIEDDPEDWGRTIFGVPVLGPLAEVASTFPHVALAIVSARPQDENTLSKIIGSLPFSRVLVLPYELGLQSLWVDARDFDGQLGLEVRRNLLLPIKRFQKDVLDYLIGGVAMLFAAPIIVFFCLWIFLADPGPIFFLQSREGQGGKHFKIIKLRTMYFDAKTRLDNHLMNSPEAQGEWNAYFKLRDDPRILPFVGKLLRRLSIDELPQLWNVLRGDMAIVGPRPLPNYHVTALSAKIREFRQSVKPGITGMWQTRLRSDGDVSMMERLDMYYVNNWSIWLDVTILLDTALIVISGKGAR